MAEDKTRDTKKAMYGYVETPRILVDEMLDVLPRDYVGGDQPTRWLDCGAGRGAIGRRLAERFPRASVDLVELNAEMLPALRAELLAAGVERRTRVVHDDFLTWAHGATYDGVVANPPYNTGGVIKTPTNTTLQKADDGRTVWRDFIRRSLEMVRPGGHAVFLVPSIWMRGGNEVYDALLVGSRPETIRCMGNTESNFAFGMQAQTPTCIVHVRRRGGPLDGAGAGGGLRLLDGAWRVGVPPELIAAAAAPRSRATPDRIGLPTGHARILLKLWSYTRAREGRASVGPLVRKTTLPVRTNPPTENGAWLNVRTVKLGSAARRNKRPYAVFERTAAPTKFGRTGPKLVLAHKMYGLPMLDASGTVGVTNADSYVVALTAERAASLAVGEAEALRALQAYMCGPLALLVFESVRYRMRFLEREAFAYMPDVCPLLSEPAVMGAGPVGAPAWHRALWDQFGLDEADAGRIEAFGKSLRFELDPAEMVL